MLGTMIAPGRAKRVGVAQYNSRQWGSPTMSLTSRATTPTQYSRSFGLRQASARLSAFIELMKPRVMSLIVFTGLVGLSTAPGTLEPGRALIALLCIAAGAGGAGVLNMWYDADIDASMTRTARRPIPSGRVSPSEALVFGLLLAGGSVALLGLMLNMAAAALLAFTIFFYVVVYTFWLKRRTAQNIVIGGAAGALPPVIGWAAVTGHVTIEPLVMFLIIFLWTPAHFWALALIHADKYARVGIPMLPVVKGRAETKKQILIYSLLLLPASAMPWMLGFAGAIYGVVAILAAATMIFFAVRLRNSVGPKENGAAGRLFGISIVYLFLLFALLLFDATAIQVAPS